MYKGKKNYDINVGIRADGNTDIGLGHIIRTMALANELKKRNCNVYYMIKNDVKALEILKENNFHVIPLEEDLKVDNEIQIVNETIEEYNIDIIICDASHIDQYYINKLNRGHRIVVIVDVLRDMEIDADVLINGGIYATDYQKKVEEYNRLTLLGPQYALLRRQFFLKKERSIKNKVLSVLITMGGSDVFGATSFFIKAISKYDSNLKINVVIGKSCKNTEEIKKITKNLPNITLHYAVDDMAKLMQENDLAISAGGTTLYELAAMGIPALIVTQAENQVLQTRRFSELGVNYYLGDVKELSEYNFLKVFAFITRSPSKRKEMSEKGQLYVDGKGVKRCTNNILNEYNRIVQQRLTKKGQ